MKLSESWQNLIPQHLLSRMVGWVAESKTPWLKNWVIKKVKNHFGIDLHEAEFENYQDYPTYNAFFTRALKPTARPIVPLEDAIISPSDGFISALGKIEKNQIFQAKQHVYTLDALLAGKRDVVEAFINGSFATIYLSPKDYHRVHLPIAGQLKQMIYVPGKLFSVNKAAVDAIPSLFARNERVINVFETELGPMAVIMVGAMLVASIKTVWHGVVAPNKKNVIQFFDYEEQNIELNKGDEMGRFQYGSTVIVLFAGNTVHWQSELRVDDPIKMGSLLGLNKMNTSKFS